MRERYRQTKVGLVSRLNDYFEWLYARSSRSASVRSVKVARALMGLRE